MRDRCRWLWVPALCLATLGVTALVGLAPPATTAPATLLATPVNRIDAGDYGYDLVAAATAVRERKASRLYLPAYVYHLRSAIDFRELASDLIVEGDGRGSLIYMSGKATTFACDGTRVSFRDLRGYGDPADPPDIAITWARAGSGPHKGWSVSGMTIARCTFDGSFNQAAVYNLACELDAIEDSFVGSTSAGVVYASDDLLKTGRTTDTSWFTCSRHSLRNVGISALRPLVVSGTVTHLAMYDGYLCCNGGKAFLELRSYPMANGRLNRPRMTVLGPVLFEGTADYGVWYRAEGGQMAADLIQGPLFGFASCKKNSGTEVVP